MAIVGLLLAVLMGLSLGFLGGGGSILAVPILTGLVGVGGGFLIVPALVV